MSLKPLSVDELRQYKGTNFVGVGVVFFCYDGSGKFLMSKRSQKCRDEQGNWEVCGGGLKWGDTAEDTVKRELKEELDADAQKIDFLGYRDVFRKLDDGTPTHWLMLDFAIKVDPQQVKRNELDMSDEIGWFNLGHEPSPLHSQYSKFMAKYSVEIEKILNR